jgi:GNAT superfamily N-acetyltransferase
MGENWQVRTAEVPTSLNDDGAWALHAAAEVHRLAQDASWGYHDLAYTAMENLAMAQHDTYTRRMLLVAVAAEKPSDVTERPSEVAGLAYLGLPQVGNTHLLEVEIVVHPDLAGRGVDDALLDSALEHARSNSRRVVILSSEHVREPAAGDADALAAPTGSGRISRADPGAALAERAGFRLEQAERYSVLTLPVAPERLARLREQAAAVAGPDYRTVTWEDRCPDEWVDEFARLESRMNTDAPTAALEIVEDPWDAARVRDTDDSTAREGRGCLVCAVEHVPTGTLAGFTMVVYPWASPEVVFQFDTLVLREHRGNRLGLLVKAVALERLAQVWPRARRVHTWNAEENSFMLGINVALGFVPTGVFGMWQKHLQ